MRRPPSNSGVSLARRARLLSAQSRAATARPAECVCHDRSRSPNKGSPAQLLALRHRRNLPQPRTWTAVLPCVHQLNPADRASRVARADQARLQDSARTRHRAWLADPYKPAAEPYDARARSAYCARHRASLPKARRRALRCNSPMLLLPGGVDIRPATGRPVANPASRIVASSEKF